MYGYNIKAKGFSLLIVFVLISLALFVDKWGFKALFFLSAVFMTKDAIRVLSAQYYVTSSGLHLKDRFGDKEVINWRELEYITITKKNKKWVALVMPQNIHYLKQNIDDREALMHTIIEKVKGSKTLAIHDDINERFNLGLTLNDEGRILRRK